ncbi:MAG: hypothetical protein ACJAVR_002285 [Paracoccaceae bacterium]|jgi:hypothetical protein
MMVAALQIALMNVQAQWSYSVVMGRQILSLANIRAPKLRRLMCCSNGAARNPSRLNALAGDRHVGVW